MPQNYPKVRFFGLPSTKSGYGNATIAFSKLFSGSKIKTNFVFPKKASKNFLKDLNNYKEKCNIDLFLHTPPFSMHKTRNYKIGYFYWETDTLPTEWRFDIIKSLDEIWAPCALVKTACLNAGFKGPIEIVPTPLCYDSTFATDVFIPSPISSNFLVSEGVFKFYSIFQWHKRKGYQELLKAYFSEFSSNDNVILIIKTNPLNGDSGSVEKIKFDILSAKNKINKKNPPKIFLITDFLSSNDLLSLHSIGDCFVLPHRGEGWGMPIHEAVQAGNHVITTKYGGITEWLDNDSANIIRHSLGPVKGMEWSPLYRPNQQWAYPDYEHLMQIMRNIYSDPDSFSKKCLKAKKVINSFNIKNCTNIVESIFLKNRFLDKV